MTDSDRETSRLTVVCRDGTEIGCTNFEAIESGVLLTEDLKKNRVFGFVSNDEVRFVLPTESVERDVRPGENAAEFEDPLKQLPGVGSTYAKRLQSSGYDALEDVASAAPSELSDETGAREDETREWVEQATQVTRAEGDEDEDEDEVTLG
jgi:hypothetical protein